MARVSFMINYRVDDLDELFAQLRSDGVTIVKGPESEANGRFAWILDPDGKQARIVATDALGRQERAAVTGGDPFDAEMRFAPTFDSCAVASLASATCGRSPS